jgi:tripartite-type tricarboxylate transporter receptor subunit TctC
MLRKMVNLSVVVLFITGSLFLATLVPFSWAADYPERPITFVVPFAPGASDLEVRTMAPKMQSIVGQPIMVENREGGGGSIGAYSVLQSRPDGYTVLFGSVWVVTLIPLISKVPYTMDDFIPIASTTIVPGAILCVRTESPWKTIREFLDYAKKNPGTLKYGTPGVGSMSHLQEAAISEAANIKTIHVPFKGASDANISLVGGHIDFAVMAPYAFLPLVRGGKLRPLVNLSKKRHPDYPDTPTTVEVGIPAPTEIADTYHGVFAPKGTSPAICVKLTDAIRKTLSDQGVIDDLKKRGCIVEFIDQRELKDANEKQFLVFKELTAKLGLQKK